MKPMTMAARLATAALLMASTVLALAATNAPTASLWSRMWRTPDQRGQALLRQGDAAGAAQEFVDPQRKGHASLQAHDYAGASKTLSGVDTAEAHYNRGNALAHTGDLQGAIDAYDAALKLNPQHTDARHNRDVVAAALKKNKDEKQESSKQDQKKTKKSKAKKTARRAISRMRSRIRNRMPSRMGKKIGNQKPNQTVKMASQTLSLRMERVASPPTNPIKNQATSPSPNPTISPANSLRTSRARCLQPNRDNKPVDHRHPPQRLPAPKTMPPRRGVTLKPVWVKARSHQHCRKTGDPPQLQDSRAPPMP